MATVIAASERSGGVADRDSDARPTTKFWTLTLGSIGVVYGDIGTSPLYAVRESVLAASAGGPPGEAAIVGSISLIVWALFVLVTLKYVVILLSADNNGEGGTLALMALARRAVVGRGGAAVVSLGIVSASLFYGDAIITPALSVLSAVEGLKVATPALDPYVAPLAVVILFALFAIQSRGTAKVAAFFGPITVIWFLAIAFGGAIHIIDHPGILRAFDPTHGVAFVVSQPLVGFITLGAAFLAVTGAEALYADLGHFGRGPVRLAWIGVVLPALLVNYLGQGALLLAKPDAIESPFFLLYPHWALLPMVLLATVATVIASQAVITGAYSLTQQAVQLGLVPRLEIRHTSASHAGQIYMPRVNTLLLAGVLLIVGLFRSSSSLASAYGIAVTGTMVVTGLLAIVVIWKVWHWPLWAAIGVIAPFLCVDLTFLAANLLKVLEGGWLPLVLAGVLMTVMYTWRRGSKMLFDKTRRLETPLADLVRQIERKPPLRVPGTAVFLTGDPLSAPTALLHSLKHYKVLHEKNVVLTVHTTTSPRVSAQERVRIEPLSESFTRLVIQYGFMETPNVPKALAIARKLGWTFDIMSTSFFLSRRAIKPAAQSGMPLWQDRLFIGMAKSASDASDFFQIPTGRVVEIGTQVAV